PAFARQLRGADLAADRIRDRDTVVPAVLHDGAGRIAGGVAHRRRRTAPLFLGYAIAAVAHQHGGAVRDPLHLRLEPISLAAADYDARRHADHRDRHPQDDHHVGRADRMAAGDGDRCAGDAAAGGGRDPDAETVRARTGRDRKMKGRIVNSEWRMANGEWCKRAHVLLVPIRYSLFAIRW